MDLSSASALSRAVEPYLAIAAQREDLELLHLLSTSPETPPMSDDEDEDSPMAREAEIRRRRSTTEQAPSGLANEAARPKVRQIRFVSDDAGASAHVFEREEVPQLPAVPPASALSALLRADGGAEGGAAASRSGKLISVRIFGDPIPGDPMAVLVPERASMAEVIAIVLAQYMEQQDLQMLYLKAKDFELLMAEDDGTPDEDMPHIKRESALGEFGWKDFHLRKMEKPAAGESSTTELPKVGGRSLHLPPPCIRRLTHVAPAAPQVDEDAPSPSAPGGSGGGGGGAAAAATGLVRIHLPGDSHGQRLQERSFLHKAKSSALLSELLEQVCRLPKVQLDASNYVFSLRDDEQARMHARTHAHAHNAHTAHFCLRPDRRWPTCRPMHVADTAQGRDLDMAASLGSLKLDDSGGGLVITRRGFADAPQLRYGSTKGSGELDEQEARAPCRRSCYGRTAHSTACILRPASPLQARDTDFIFSDVTAARYKEYAVVKVNKRGLKQSRVLGIDGERFYNIAREKTHGGDGRLEAEAGAVARKEAASSLRDWGLRQVGLRSTTDGTKHPFHLIRDIDHVTMGETPKEVWGSRHGGAAPAAARFTPRAPPSRGSSAASSATRCSTRTRSTSTGPPRSTRPPRSSPRSATSSARARRRRRGRAASRSSTPTTPSFAAAAPPAGAGTARWRRRRRTISK